MGDPRIDERRMMRTPLPKIGLDYPGYEVDPDLCLWSTKGKVHRKLKMSIHKSGYPIWQLSHMGQKVILMVHRLVCFLHHGQPSSPDLEVCHKNDDKLDYSPSNVEWGTRSHNQQQSLANGKHRSGQRPGFNNSSHKLTPEALLGIRQALALRQNQYDIAARYNVSQSTVSLIKLGKRWASVESATSSASSPDSLERSDEFTTTPPDPCGELVPEDPC
jgi:DNA-binding transcriptional regulator YiaG